MWPLVIITAPPQPPQSKQIDHIENQLKEDEMGEQLTMSQYGPFTGGK